MFTLLACSSSVPVSDHISFLPKNTHIKNSVSFRQVWNRWQSSAFILYPNFSFNFKHIDQNVLLWLVFDLKMKPIPKLFNYKLLLTSTSLLYLICGIVLTISGYLLFMNSDQIILSKLLQVTNERLSELSEPLFYYVSLGLTLVGLVVSFSAIIGCWTIYGSNNYCTLSIVSFILKFYSNRNSINCFCRPTTFNILCIIKIITFRFKKVANNK